MAILLAVASPVVGQAAGSAPLWACTLADGSVVFSDRELSGECEALEDLPPLQRRAPAPSQDTGVPPAEPRAREDTAPAPVPIPGGGRRIDPPTDGVIRISGITAVPSFNGLLGIAHYQATMVLENLDSVWTAEKVCVDVRFRDRSHIFVDVHQIGCTTDLRPFTPRTLTVTYTGIIPPRLVPIDAEATVEFVRWTK